MIDRRTLLQTAAACGALSSAASASAAAGSIDLQRRTPQDDLLIWAKLKADLSGRTLYSVTTGTVWGFKPQADDQQLADFATRLYGYSTCIARRASLLPNGNVSIRSRSWNFYLHPETHEFARELLNPYTGKTVTAAPMIAPAREQIFNANGSTDVPSIPVEQSKPPRPFDLGIRVIGERAFVTESSFVRFKPNDISWYKLEGNLWSHSCALRDLTNTRLTHIPSTWSQNLVAEWQTWMNMHGTPGHILFKGDGCHLDRIEKIPDDVRRNIETVTPGGLSEPL